MEAEKTMLISLEAIDHREQVALSKYMKGVAPLFAAAGAKALGRYRVRKRFSDGDGPDTLSLLEFPSTEALEEVFSSPEYQATIPHRDKAFKTHSFYVAQPV